MASKKFGKDIIDRAFEVDGVGKFAPGTEAVDLIKAGLTPEQVASVRASEWTHPEDEAAEAVAKAEAEADDEDKGESHPHYYGTGKPPADTWEGITAAKAEERAAKREARRADQAAHDTPAASDVETTSTSKE